MRTADLKHEPSPHPALLAIWAFERFCIFVQIGQCINLFLLWPIGPLRFGNQVPHCLWPPAHYINRKSPYKLPLLLWCPALLMNYCLSSCLCSESTQLTYFWRLVVSEGLFPSLSSHTGILLPFVWPVNMIHSTYYIEHALCFPLMNSLGTSLRHNSQSKYLQQHQASPGPVPYFLNAMELSQAVIKYWGSL